jgi:hypothetical protein
MAIKNRKVKSGKINKLPIRKNITKNVRETKELDVDFEAFKEALSVDNYMTRTECMAGLRLA